MQRRTKTLVLGLGNPILSDDGVGIRVASELRKRLGSDRTEIVEAAAGGLDLLDMMVGYEKVVLIDAIMTRRATPGSIVTRDVADLAHTVHLSSPHGVNFATALELGKRVGFEMPKTVCIYAVEVDDVTTFSEQCTPAVQAAIPELARRIIEEHFQI